MLSSIQGRKEMDLLQEKLNKVSILYTVSTKKEVEGGI